jgi:hypothetical protein
LASISDLKDEAEKLKEEANATEARVMRANANERRAYNKLSDFQQAHGGHSDPFVSSASLLKILASSGCSNEDMVKGFLAALCEKKKTRQHITNAVLDSAVGKEAQEQVEVTFYKSFQEKFAPSLRAKYYQFARPKW